MSTNVNAEAEVEETNKNSIRDLTIEYENLPHMGFIETLRIIARSWSFVRFFKWRFFIKWSLTLLSLMFPVLVLPWTLQIMIDHVVLGNPIDGSSGYLGFPAYMHPILDLMQDMSAIEILIWLTASSFLLVIFLVLIQMNKGTLLRLICSRAMIPLPSKTTGLMAALVFLAGLLGTTNIR